MIGKIHDRSTFLLFLKRLILAFRVTLFSGLIGKKTSLQLKSFYANIIHSSAADFQTQHWPSRYNWDPLLPGRVYFFIWEVFRKVVLTWSKLLSSLTLLMVTAFFATLKLKLLSTFWSTAFTLSTLDEMLFWVQVHCCFTWCFPC